MVSPSFATPRRPQWVIAFFVWFLVSFGLRQVGAQDLRVYTTVTQLDKDGKTVKPLSHSLTVFHAGKSYDFLTDLGEVVIVEPLTSKFWLLDGNSVGVKGDFSEIKQFVKAGRTETVKFIEDANGRQTNLASANALQFQLDPKFEEKFEERSGQLSMASEFMHYDIKTSAAGSPDHVDRYLEYADWTARLNYVLHPNSLYPAPRLALNAALRKHRSLPVTVDLRLDPAAEFQLRAEHKYGWKLQPIDRQHIDLWERTLNSDKVHWVSFHEYQHRLMKISKN